VTLVYLANQVRYSKVALNENTKSVRAAAAAATQDSLAGINDLVAGDIELAKLLGRLVEQGSMEGFSIDERLRSVSLMRANAQRFESMFFRYEADLLQARIWNVRRNWFAGWIRTPGVAGWWKEERVSSCYTNEFIEDIESANGIALGSTTQRA
jgi:hypothetical protein